MPGAIKTAVLTLLFAAATSAAAQSDEVKAYNLGVDAYRARNYELARQHWTKAVDEGLVDAYNNLGFLLYNGLGGPEQAARAVSLWRSAAMMGQSESQWHMASALEEGKGIVQSDVEAYAWYRCAQAGYRAGAKDDAESEVAKDTVVSAARVLARLPESRRKLADDLANIYTTLYAGKP